MSEKPYKPQWWDSKMTDLGGRNYKGEPRLRTVWGGEERRWDGKFKYYDPFDARKPMECWIVEVWMPPKFFGDPADWNAEMCGPFPSEGVYGIKTPLMDYNGTLPLTEETFNCIKRKQLLDVEWSEQDAKARFEDVEKRRLANEADTERVLRDEMHNTLDHYYAHQEELDNDDNRVFSFPSGIIPVTVNGKMPVKI